MKFVITVDVEADNQWKDTPVDSIENVFSLPRFHKLALKYGFKPTYLLAYEVASNDRARDMLKPWVEAGEAEVGAHLHPWSTPPLGTLDSFKRFPSELSDGEIRSKLENLTNIIRQKFGRPPRSYRAGRFGFDARQANLLERIGYLVDCSITPKISWKRAGSKEPGESGPDWREAPVYPYHISLENLVTPAQAGLLEIPVTILGTGICGREGRILKFLSTFPDGIIAKVIRKILVKMKWLRIFPETDISDLQAVYFSAVRNKLPVIEFMIHSSELVAGGSPYVKNEEMLAKLYKNLESLFGFLRDRGVSGETLSEVALSHSENEK